MIRHLCACSLLLLGAGCGGDLFGPERAMGLVLEASVSSPSIEDGQVDTMTVTLTNTNPAPITLHFSSGCRIMPALADALGRLIVPSEDGWVCTLDVSSLTLAPRESQSLEFLWSGSTTFAPVVPKQTLPHGVYYLFATLDSREVRMSSERVAVRLQ